MDAKTYSYKYPHPALTADCVVFGFDGRRMYVLLIERGLEPHKGAWALPGGFMRIDETIEQAAYRELFEETGVMADHLEQLHVFSAVGRDPRERVVTVAFYGLLRKTDFKLIAGDDAALARWHDIDSLPRLAFDHEEIIKMARERLREVIHTRPVAFKLLDKHFSISDLQRVYEIITGREFDRRNFARKVTSSGMVVNDDGCRSDVPRECKCLSEHEAQPGRRPTIYRLEDDLDDDGLWQPRDSLNLF